MFLFWKCLFGCAPGVKLGTCHSDLSWNFVSHFQVKATVSKGIDVRKKFLEWIRNCRPDLHINDQVVLKCLHVFLTSHGEVVRKKERIWCQCQEPIQHRNAANSSKLLIYRETGRKSFLLAQFQLNFQHNMLCIVSLCLPLIESEKFKATEGIRQELCTWCPEYRLVNIL